MAIRFEWDPRKASDNIRKHGIAFETAARVFMDPLSVTTQDRIENGEYRWQTIGSPGGHTLLLVAHTLKEDTDRGRPVEIIRILSARKANKKERRRYERGAY